MATTTNYGWETPDDTDLVKDGALAMRTLGSAVDTSLYNITNGKNVGLVPLSTTSMSGTTIDFTSVFSSTYDNYRIIFTNVKVGTGSTAVRLRMLSGSTPASGSGDYVYGGWSSAYNSSGLSAIFSGTTSTHTFLGEWAADGRFCILDVLTPNLANYTGFSMQNYGASGAYSHNGLHAVNTAYNGFRIFADGGGTITGTARIYGYRNS